MVEGAIKIIEDHDWCTGMMAATVSPGKKKFMDIDPMSPEVNAYCVVGAVWRSAMALGVTKSMSDFFGARTGERSPLWNYIRGTLLTTMRSHSATYWNDKVCQSKEEALEALRSSLDA